MVSILAHTRCALPAAREGKRSGPVPVALTNVTPDAVRVARAIEEQASGRGEFKLDGLPEVGPWQTTTVGITVTPTGNGVRQARFRLLDDEGEDAGEVAAVAMAPAQAHEGSDDPASCGASFVDSLVSTPIEAAPDLEGTLLSLVGAGRPYGIAGVAGSHGPYDAKASMTTEWAVRSPHAFDGTKLHLLVDKAALAPAVRAYSSRLIGPGRAGPYQLVPWVDEFDALVYFLAVHDERKQGEWVIGPEQVDDFVSSVELYVGVANRALPGSPNVPDTQRAGATDTSNPISVVEKAAFGQAPWQQFDGLDAKDRLLDGMDASNGGSALLLGLRNSTIRIEEYIKPAKEMATQLAHDVQDGKLHHLDARRQAVTGRNELLQRTRARISPSARAASRRMKEEGPSLEKMTAKKTKDLLAQYRGYVDGTMASQLKPDELARLRARLDADTELWAKHAAAMEAAGAVSERERFAAALTELGESPEVSREIIKSAGKTNTWVSRGARYARGASAVGAAVGLVDFAFDVVDEIEARQWHALAGELGGFAGGVVGGELGAMGAVFLASLIPGAGGALILFVSLIGGMVGSAAGAHGARLGTLALVDALEQGAMGAGIAPATGMSHYGGMAGRYSMSRAHGTAVAKQAADAIYAMDEELRKISASIPHARHRAELEMMQRARLNTLERRQQLEELLTAIRLGAFDDDRNSSEMAAPEPADVPETPPLPACDPIDDDCDVRFD